MPIIDLFNSLSPELQVWAEYWIADGAYEDPPYENEPYMITSKLRSFRLAYKNATDEQRDELINKIL